MAFDIGSYLGSCKYSPGQTVGIKTDISAKTSNTLTYEPFEIIAVHVNGSTLTNYTSWGYEVKSRRNTGARNNQIITEASLITWASVRTLAKAAASVWVSVPTIN
jgi:hypothetical protein